METWPDACFKAYDIRGLASGNGTGEPTPGFAYLLGRALTTYLKCDSFAVGRDIRDSSPVLAMQLMACLQRLFSSHVPTTACCSRRW
ncbi:MAG: hypothetical protein VYA57_04435 [Candidatus Thermoplasmatota archaeon]|nr:hypothetical protein [Candidatus Thermoplasmatota archaeon]